MKVPDMDMVYSGMKFIDIGSDNCFRIEDSKLYQKSLSHLGFKSVEFVNYHAAENINESKLIFIEAKTTLRQTCNGSRIADEVTDISQKFMDALQIICGIWHGSRKDKMLLPANFTKYRDYGKKIVFVLVIKNIDKKKLLPVKEAILRKLLKEHRLWRFDITVLDEDLAKKEALVLARDAS